MSIGFFNGLYHSVAFLLFLVSSSTFTLLFFSVFFIDGVFSNFLRFIGSAFGFTTFFIEGVLVNFLRFIGSIFGASIFFVRYVATMLSGISQELVGRLHCDASFSAATCC